MALIVSSFLPGEQPLVSRGHAVHPVECVTDLSYWDGLNTAWLGNETIVNVEHDMEFSDELVQGLLDCPNPACVYPYKVYPTALQRYIYCATTDAPGDMSYPDHEGPDKLRWVEGPEDTMAAWASIGFCKVAPEVRIEPLDRMMWQWLEHCVNRVLDHSGTHWCLHWPEVKHLHNYSEVPDHLW